MLSRGGFSVFWTRQKLTSRPLKTACYNYAHNQARSGARLLNSIKELAAPSRANLLRGPLFCETEALQLLTLGFNDGLTRDNEACAVGFLLRVAAGLLRARGLATTSALPE